MIAKIEMQLNCDTVNYRNSSNLQGVIMENIDTGYADFLHQQGLNPYSQYVHKRKAKRIGVYVLLIMNHTNRLLQDL